MVRSKRYNKTNALPGIPNHVASLCSKLTEQLMQLCLNFTVSTRNAQSVFKELYHVISELCSLQAEFRLVDSASDRKKYIEALLSLYPNAKVEATAHNAEGYGLVATCLIEESDLILRIPSSSLLFVPSVIENKKLRELLLSDPLASKMDNVALSLFILSEVALGSKSQWNTYLMSLPRSYSTLCYLTEEDVASLKGSPAIETAVTNYQHICRQYAYFFKKFQTAEFASLFRFLCFEDYRWAVSTVMSRSNAIPISRNGKETLCLIPVWDLTNHKSNRMTTDFDTSTNELLFYAMETYLPGEQVFMDYGKRSNIDFLLFSGFVPVHNPYNKVIIKLGISSSDLLAEERMTVLRQLTLNAPVTCDITATELCPTNLLVFARVFVMLEDELKSLLNADDESALIPLKAKQLDSTCRIDAAALGFLQQRFQLLIRAYGSVLASEPPNNVEPLSIPQYCERLRCQEVNLLTRALAELDLITKNDPPVPT